MKLIIVCALLMMLLQVQNCFGYGTIQEDNNENGK